MNTNSGTLYVVATPIGNLSDVTFRAVEILKSVSKIAAEDTRHIAQLLNHYHLRVPTVSLHDFNERDRAGQLITALKAGESIALVSDAGTPLISDPGYHLVAAVRAAGLSVVPIPGACAAIAALCAAGLPTDKFTFEGFLPSTDAARLARLQTLKYETRTMIFYESPRRLLSLLLDIQTVFGEAREMSVARELTKIHESILTESVSDLFAYYTAHANELKGEAVVLVAGNKASQLPTKEVIPENVLRILLTEMPLKRAAALTSQITGVGKNELYALGLSMK